jgi:hypothetical protein
LALKSVIEFDHSMTFLIYAFILYLIHLYTTSGRNGTSKKIKNIEMSRRAWYARVPNAEVEMPNSSIPLHVIGDEDEEPILRP